MPRCEMEMCPNWSGDGRICDCARYDGYTVLGEGPQCESEIPEGWTISPHPPRCVLDAGHSGQHTDIMNRLWD